MTLIATEITNIQTPRFWNYFDNESSGDELGILSYTLAEGIIVKYIILLP